MLSVGLFSSRYTTYIHTSNFAVSDWKDSFYFPKLKDFSGVLHKQSGKKFKIIDFIQIMIVLYLEIFRILALVLYYYKQITNKNPYIYIYILYVY